MKVRLQACQTLSAALETGSHLPTMKFCVSVSFYHRIHALAKANHDINVQILMSNVVLFFIYLFMKDREREKERERGRDTGRGRSRLHAGSPMWDTVRGLQDQALG